MMLVRRSTQLSFALVGSVILGVLFFVVNDRMVLQEMLNQSISEKESFFDSMIRTKHESLQRALEDYTSWEELTHYVAKPTRKWAKDNIDSILNTYKADGYWVFDAKGRLISSLLQSKEGLKHNQPFPGTLPDFKGRVILPNNSYTDTSDGILELFSSSIHFAHDLNRTGTVHGYFIFARYLDDNYIKELSTLTNWNIKLAPYTNNISAHSYHDNELVIRRTIKDFSGRPIAMLLAKTSLPAISRLEEHNRMHATSGFLFVLLFVAALVCFINYQRTLRRAKRNLDEAQKLAKVGSWERDIETGTGFWSENSFRLLGLEPRKAAPDLEELYRLICDDDRELFRTTLQTAMTTGQDYEVEFRPANDPEHRVFRTRGKALRNETGKPVRMVGTLQDITEKHQQALAREELLKQKEMFIVRLSHDIKTPLTPLVALLPQIRYRVTDEKLRSLLDLCIDNVNHMKELVVKTIKLARFSSPGQTRLVDMDSLPLSELVHEYLRKRSDILQSSMMHTEIAIDPSITVKADRIELEEVFYNLISNAVKYSPTESRVEIAATEKDGKVTVRITDTGIGLFPEELNHIFDEFFKADQSRHELDSSGLGLSICKRIIENHGGRIWAESPGKGQGTSICFTISTGGDS